MFRRGICGFRFADKGDAENVPAGPEAGDCCGSITPRLLRKEFLPPAKVLMMSSRPESSPGTISHIPISFSALARLPMPAQPQSEAARNGTINVAAIARVFTVRLLPSGFP